MPHQPQAANPFAGLLPGGANQQGLSALLGPNFPSLGAAPQGLATTPAAQIPLIQQLFNLLSAAQGGLPPQAQAQPTLGVPPLPLAPTLPAAVQTPLALPGAQSPNAQAPAAAPGIATAQQPRAAPVVPAAPRPAQPVRPAPQAGGPPVLPALGNPFRR